jgi:4-hydroxy-2-oxoglutarate aldolase
MAELRGVVIPAVTPFDAAGELRLDLLRENLNAWGRTAVAGYMFLGSNGEARSLSDAESIQVAEAAAGGKGDKCLILGVGRESTYQTLFFLDQVSDIKGIDYVSVLTPSYFAKSMGASALVAHYVKVADASRFPVLIYVAPEFANQVTPTA